MEVQYHAACAAVDLMIIATSSTSYTLSDVAQLGYTFSLQFMSVGVGLLAERSFSSSCLLVLCCLRLTREL